MAKKTIKGVGPIPARIMFVGEAPGATEVKTGEPFQGASGKVLDAWLEELGLGRDEVFLTNVVKYKLPNNRNPKAEELNEALPALMKEIQVVQPTYIFTLGLVPLKALVPMLNEPLEKLAGKKVRKFFGNKHITIVPMYHPIGYKRAKQEIKERVDNFLKVLKKALGNV